MAKKDKIVALDIGASEVRAVEVSIADDEIAITGFGYAPVEDAAGRAEAVTTALNRGGIKTRKAVTSLSGRLVVVRPVSMPRMPVEKLKGAIGVEASKYIPFDVEDAVIDCQVLAEPEPEEGEELSPEIDVWLVAAKRNIIEDHVAEMGRIGVYPIIVDYDCFALGNAFEFREMAKSAEERENKIVALVDVGAEKSSINVMAGINSYFTREVPGGGVELTEAIARRLSVDTEAAEMLKRNPGERAEEVMEAVLGPLDDLMGEIGLSFDYFESQHDTVIEEVLVSGGTCRLAGVIDVFEQHFGKPTDFWDPLEGLELRLPEEQIGQIRDHVQTIAVAIGLAARITDEGSP